MHVTSGEMKSVSEENKENPTGKNSQPINDLLMKPFSLGWTREVVRRAVTHSGTPNCDVYYFNPNKKKLRSLIEVKSNLTDGLSLDCFSFKREPLGLSSDLEIVRDAKARGKGIEKSKEKRNVSDGLRKAVRSESPKKKKTETEEEESKPDTKKKKTETKGEEEESKTEKSETEENLPNAENRTEAEDEKESKNISETKTRRAKSDSKESKESKSFNSKSKTRPKAKPTKPVRLQSLKSRKSALKRVVSAKQAKQAKVVPGRKLLKKIVSKKVATPKRKLTKAQNEKKSGSKSKKDISSKAKRGKKASRNSLAKSKNETAKVPETNENDKKAVARDLKSIVKKNIGKYREMREKQKLGAVKNQVRNQSRKLSIATVSRSRSEPISKNRPVYLKPLEKGWRRELVYRTNCAKAGQQADVYYFHPNGKKLRSCREIAENLTHGLSIECFTFRKEPIGCGEPSEVIRNAKSFQKN